MAEAARDLLARADGIRSAGELVAAAREPVLAAAVLRFLSAHAMVVGAQAEERQPGERRPWALKVTADAGSATFSESLRAHLNLMGLQCSADDPVRGNEMAPRVLLVHVSSLEYSGYFYQFLQSGGTEAYCPVLIRPGEVSVGPVFSAGERPCGLCLLTRLSSCDYDAGTMWSLVTGKEPGALEPSAAPPYMPASAAAALARLLSNPRNGYFVTTADTGTSDAHRLLPVPGCLQCGGDAWPSPL